jgi:hypothetical protein
MVVLGIDPAYGKKCAYAVIGQDERVLEHGKFQFQDAVLKIGELKKKHCIDALACEANYLKLNVATTQKLSEVLGWLQSAARANQLEFAVIHPLAWQSKIPSLKRLKGKFRENYIISLIFPFIPIPTMSIDIDTACAIHIGQYRLRRMKAELLKSKREKANL